MKIRGYIKELVPNSFTIPIYNSEGKYYYHVLDDNFRIKEFTETKVEDDTFVPWFSGKNYNVGEIGAVAFIGKDNYLKFDDALSAVEEIISYLNETTEPGEYKNIKKEALELRAIVVEQLRVITARQVFENTRITAKIFLSHPFDHIKPGAAIWVRHGHLGENLDNKYNFPNITVKLSDQFSFLKLLEDDNLPDIDDDPIQKEIVAQLFQNYINDHLAGSNSKIFNKSFLNKFGKILSDSQYYNLGNSPASVSFCDISDVADILNPHHRLPYWHLILNSKAHSGMVEESESIYFASPLPDEEPSKIEGSHAKRPKLNK